MCSPLAAISMLLALKAVVMVLLARWLMAPEPCAADVFRQRDAAGDITHEQYEQMLGSADAIRPGAESAPGLLRDYCAGCSLSTCHAAEEAGAVANGRTVCGFCHAMMTSQIIQARSKTKASNPGIVPFAENPSAPTTIP